MTINNLKDLAKLIALCQKTGVEAIKIDGIEMAIRPKTLSKAKRVPSFDYGVPAEANAKITIDEPIDMPDELSDDQLLMWSAQGTQPS